MKERIIYAIYISIVWPLSLLPFWALYALSDGLAILFHSVIRYRRRVVRENIASAFPDKDEKWRAEVERGFYRNFADVIVETIKLLHISDKEMRKRLKLVDVDIVERCAAEHKSIVLYLGHYCNWEWVPAIDLFYTPEIITGHIYKRLHDAAADKLMLKVRSRFGSVGIEMNQAVRRMIAMHREGKIMIIGFIADQRPEKVHADQTTCFLNHETHFTVGGESIARHIGAVAVYLDVERTARGHYRLTFKPIHVSENDAAPWPVTREYYRLFEQTIRRAPANWLWSHRRWKQPQ